MTVKDVIIGAAQILDETALCSALTDENATLTDENAEKKNKLLKCFNDVLFEIAAEYCPLAEEEESDAGKILFSSFSKAPLKIKCVFCGDESIGFRLGTNYIETEKRAGKVNVVYEYVPEEKTETMAFDYEKTPYGKTVFCYGIAAEYCLITGRISDAANWESRFKNALTAVAAPRKRTKKITTGKVWK